MTEWMEYMNYDTLRQLAEKYEMPNRKNSLILIPFSAFPKVEEGSSVREYEWWAYAVKSALSMESPAFAIANYTIRCICVKKEISKMQYEITIPIPYGKRSAYQDLLYEICQCISDDGDVTLFVSNNPYALKAYVVITEEQELRANMIKALIESNEIPCTNEKGLLELMKEAGVGRLYNLMQLPRREKKEIFCQLFQSNFYFREEKVLQEMGYDATVSFPRKKVFISYCHKDKEVVNAITDCMEEQGMNLWIDKKSIDYGENLSAAIASGIAECDLAVLFLSTGYSDSLYAKFELQNIVCNMIQEKMHWFIVKLDQVDVQTILPVLCNYKYYDFSIEKSISDLTTEIQKILEHCEAKQ